ncbi:RHS repeat-associated core domain-containing protein [Capillibacterium thermochitinicola]|uniref:C40 family peptidase n=1 Tax=Capillibacterium thermochitinicola TaxID=2699427 RepID=A0A8J6I3R7_9FIRM|nr:RHS repeat-associated core domain-containing protein [Capillibacterium thermochitinicola]MBA2134094.1 C40 family peptidase [Capillibacterium thermochitinicola]
MPDGGKIEFKYDALNRIIERINANDTKTVYTYTPRGELESIVNYQDRGHGKVLSAYGYLYNAKGQRIYQIKEDGDLTAYRYDPAGRLIEVYYPFTDKKKIADLKERQFYGLVPQWEGPTDFKIPKLNLSWEEERNLAEQLAELSNLLFEDGKGKKDDCYLNPGPNGLPFINHLMLDYEDQNKLSNLYRQLQPWGIGLNLWGKGYWKEQFTYDPNGNVISKKNGWGEINYNYDVNNQLLQAGNRTYQYDLNGNLIREELGAFYVEYEYSPENRLVTARNNSPFIYLDRSFVGEINYAYDALGRRVSKEINPEKGNKGNIEYYLYAGLGTDVIVQYELEVHNNKGKGKGKGHDPAGELTQIQEYYYGNGFLLAAKTIDKPVKHGWGWGHDPLKDVTFYHQDVLGSVVMLTGHNGQVVEKYKYDAYGVAYDGKFDHGLAGMGRNSYGFTGKRYEPELSIYSFAFRDYNPHSMRWLTVDPIKHGLNWYQYCGSDPVNWVDLWGLVYLPEDVDYGQQVITETSIRSNIAKHAASLAGSKYVWGGEDKGGVDCSGTVYYSYTQAGISIPRTTAQGYHNLMEKIEREDLKPADIITYSDSEQDGKVVHVQVFIGTAIDRKGKIVEDAVINAGSPKTGVYIVSLEEYLSWDCNKHLTPNYGTLLNDQIVSSNKEDDKIEQKQVEILSKDGGFPYKEEDRIKQK